MRATTTTKQKQKNKTRKNKNDEEEEENIPSGVKISIGKINALKIDKYKWNGIVCEVMFHWHRRQRDRARSNESTISSRSQNVSNSKYESSKKIKTE